MIRPSHIRVLIVDDQEMMRSLTRRCLEHLGFTEIHSASKPAEALATARERRVHLVISDYRMPEMTGLDFLAAIRRDPLLSKVAFIMLSGSGDMEVVRRAHALGANSYLLKPFSLDALRDRIERCFGPLEPAKARAPAAAVRARPMDLVLA